MAQSSVLQQLTTKSKSIVYLPSFYQWLFDQIGIDVQQSVPVAALGALGADLPEQQSWWLRADPVQLQADFAQVYLVGNQHIALDLMSINPLLHTLNTLLQENAIVLHAVSAREWYLQLKTDPAIKTHELNAVIGKNIFHYFPTGQQAKWWQQLVSEIQMLLHQQHQLPANSVWLWGEGELPQQCQPKPQWQKILTNDSVVKGLAKFTQTSWSTLPRFLIESLGSQENLILVDNQIDEQRFAAETMPLIWEVWQTKKLAEFELIIGNQHYYFKRRRSLFSFLRN